MENLNALVDAALASEEEDALFKLQDTFQLCTFSTQVRDINNQMVPLVSNGENFDTAAYDALVARFKPQLQKQITAQLEVAIKPRAEDILEARELLKRGMRGTAYGQRRGTSSWERTWKSKVDSAERRKKAREEAERKKREAAQKRQAAANSAALKSSRCYWWNYPEIQACGLAFAGMRKCSASPSSSARSPCRSRATRGGKCVCGSK